MLSEAIRYHFDDLKDISDWKEHMDFLYSRKMLDMPETRRIEAESDNDKVGDVTSNCTAHGCFLNTCSLLVAQNFVHTNT